MVPKFSQGVTTVIGDNCGISIAPMRRAIPNPVVTRIMLNLYLF